MFFTPAPHYVVPTTMIDVIKHLGLETSLLWVIDAGDAASIASASNQSLGVLPSGGVQMIRGNDTNVDAFRDPVHRGTIGGQRISEYWEMNNAPSPAPSRRFISTGNTYWKHLHKNGAAFTIAGWYRLGDTANMGQSFFSTMPGAASDVGVWFSAAGTSTAPYTAGKLNYTVGNGSGTAYAMAAVTSSLSVVPTETITFVALSVDESAESITFQIDANQEAVLATYNSPSASDPTFPNELVTAGNIVVASEVLSRLYNVAFWNRALSAAELTSLYNATEAKFGH